MQHHQNKGGVAACRELRLATVVHLCDAPRQQS